MMASHLLPLFGSTLLAHRTLVIHRGRIIGVTAERQPFLKLGIRAPRKYPPIRSASYSRTDPSLRERDRPDRPHPRLVVAGPLGLLRPALRFRGRRTRCTFLPVPWLSLVRNAGWRLLVSVKGDGKMTLCTRDAINSWQHESIGVRPRGYTLIGAMEQGGGEST